LFWSIETSNDIPLIREVARMKVTVAGLGMVGAFGALCICRLCENALCSRGPSFFSAATPTVVLASSEQAVQRQAPATKVVALKIDGMTCGGCVYGVKKVLTRLEGVSKAVVSYETKSAVVTFDPARVSVDKMIRAIKTLGYTATAG
jgi:mercuric ion binding protein